MVPRLHTREGCSFRRAGIRIMPVGVSAVVKWDWRGLCSTGTQDQSLVQHSGLRIQHCHSFCVGRNSSLDLIPGPGTPSHGVAKKEKKKKE